MVTDQVLDAPAWRIMSHGARSLYVALKRRYWPNHKNDGRIYLSQRQAIKELGSGMSQIVRWFRELQHYGFIVMITPGCLGVNGKGKAPRWRLTEVSYMRGTSSRGMEDMPTLDFMKWNGVRFSKHQDGGDRLKNLESRYGKSERTVTKNRNTSVTENRNTSSNNRYGKREHIDDATVTENRSRSYKPCGAGWAGALNGRQQKTGRAGKARPARDIIDVRSQPR